MATHLKGGAQGLLVQHERHQGARGHGVSEHEGAAVQQHNGSLQRAWCIGAQRLGHLRTKAGALVLLGRSGWGTCALRLGHLCYWGAAAGALAHQG